MDHRVTSFLAACQLFEMHDAKLAIKIATESLEKTESPAFRTILQTTLGVAHYRAKNFEQAIKELEAATPEGVQPNPMIDFYLAMPQCFLAMANWKLGDLETARNHHRRAADMVAADPKNMQAFMPRFKEAQRLIVGGLAANPTSR